MAVNDHPGTVQGFPKNLAQVWADTAIGEMVDGNFPVGLSPTDDLETVFEFIFDNINNQGADMDIVARQMAADAQTDATQAIADALAASTLAGSAQADATLALANSAQNSADIGINVQDIAALVAEQTAQDTAIGANATQAATNASNILTNTAAVGAAQADATAALNLAGSKPDLLDEDDMVSNSATQVPSQQSVVAYVAAQLLATGWGTLHGSHSAAIAALEILAGSNESRLDQVDIDQAAQDSAISSATTTAQAAQTAATAAAGDAAQALANAAAAQSGVDANTTAIANIALTPGPEGPEGPTGPIGPQGIQGDAGPQGIQGVAGPAGADSTVPGPQGPAGPVGPVGPQGDQGPIGLTGPQGVAGADGAAGPIGPQGDTGPAGADSTVPGPQGTQGIQGDPGPPGPAGADGAQGIQGPTGADGPQGIQGIAGPQGIQGEFGGLVFQISGQWLLDPGEVNGWQAIGVYDNTNSADLGNIGANVSWLTGGLLFPFDVKVKRLKMWQRVNNIDALAYGWQLFHSLPVDGSGAGRVPTYLLDQVGDGNLLDNDNRWYLVDLSAPAEISDATIPAGQVITLAVAAPTAITTNRYAQVGAGFLELERV